VPDHFSSSSSEHWDIRQLSNFVTNALRSAAPADLNERQRIQSAKMLRQEAFELLTVSEVAPYSCRIPYYFPLPPKFLNYGGRSC